MNARAKKTKPKLNAEAAYDNAHLVAQDLLEHIRELLPTSRQPATMIAQSVGPTAAR